MAWLSLFALKCDQASVLLECVTPLPVPELVAHAGDEPYPKHH